MKFLEPIKWLYVEGMKWKELCIREYINVKQSEVCEYINIYNLRWVYNDLSKNIMMNKMGIIHGGIEMVMGIMDVARELSKW